MEVARRHGTVLRATICEIERGVFYATYFEDKLAPDTKWLPRYQVGKSACDAKEHLEESARAIGFQSVTWNDAILVPVFSPQPETSRRNPVVAVYDRGVADGSRWKLHEQNSA